MTKEEFLNATESAPVVLAVFERDGQAHPLVTRASEQVAGSGNEVKVINFELDEQAELIEEYLENMDPFSGTLNFEYPGFALYRDGQLITTFNPWINMNNERLNADLVMRQITVFLARMIPERFGGDAASA